MTNEQIGPTRRSLLNWFLGTSVGALLLAIAYPVVRFLNPPETAEAVTREVEAGATNDPQFLSKGYKIVRFGSEPVIVIRLGQDEFRAFSATCTHLDCIVEYQPQRERIWCNCHNGQYDLHGRVVSGPPPRPLEPYDVHLVADGKGQSTVVVQRA